METKEGKFSGIKLPGIPMLIFNLLLLIAIVLLFVWAVSSKTLSSGAITFYAILSTVLFIFSTQ